MLAGFVVLTQPVKVKIAYGETILPAGMKLPVVSSDATSVRVNYMGELQTIPIAAARFEDSTNDPPDVGAPSETTPIVLDQACLAAPSATPGYTITSFAPAGLRLPNARRRHQHARIAITFVVTL